jgi:hypothetical protein
MENRSRDLVLLLGRKLTHGFESLIEQLGHPARIGIKLPIGKGPAQPQIYSDLTMPSVIFFASPNSIIVLSR